MLWWYYVYIDVYFRLFLVYYLIIIIMDISMSTRSRIFFWSPLLSSLLRYSSMDVSQFQCLWRMRPLGRFLFFHSVRNFLLNACASVAAPSPFCLLGIHWFEGPLISLSFVDSSPSLWSVPCSLSGLGEPRVPLLLTAFAQFLFLLCLVCDFLAE